MDKIYSQKSICLVFVFEIVIIGIQTSIILCCFVAGISSKSVYSVCSDAPVDLTETARTGWTTAAQKRYESFSY